MRVGLLLPLSGSNAPLGQAMMDAAQLALFDQGDPRVEMVPRDTRSTPAGAAAAARAVLDQGVVSVAGPLTLTETAAAVGVLRERRIPLYAFTSDEAQAGALVWVLGITPAQQVRRIFAAASEGGLRRFALLAPDDAFGQRLALALRAVAADAGAPPPTILLAPPRGDTSAAVQQLAAGAPDAVLIGYGGAGAQAVAAQIAAAFPAGAPRLLGTTLWANDTSLGNEPALLGALFPGPDAEARGRFEAAYAEAFGSRPPRLAGVAYDALALAARTARDGAPPVGAAFQGADGPVRVLDGGAIARGLAVYALQPGGEAILVQPAPLPGSAGS